MINGCLTLYGHKSKNQDFKMIPKLEACADTLTFGGYEIIYKGELKALKQHFGQTGGD